MVTIIMAIALLVAVAGLAVEIGIASWNICRADRYRRKADATKHAEERAVVHQQETARQMESLDEYAAKVSWLLNFLYKRYDKFADLERQLNEGQPYGGDTPIGDVDDRHKDLKRAMKIIRVTVEASERVGNLVESIASQAEQIMENFRDEDEEPGSDTEKLGEEKKEEASPESDSAK